MSINEWKNLYKKMKKDVKKYMINQADKLDDDLDIGINKINKMKVNSEDIYWALNLVKINNYSNYILLSRSTYNHLNLYTNTMNVR